MPPKPHRNKRERERTESGEPIYRYTERTREQEFVVGDPESLERITAHFERHIGRPDNVYHEILSELVHIDVHIIKPCKKRNFYTLLTSGMSDRPMTPPPEAPHCSYAELMICLPPDWPMTDKALRNNTNYWPIYWLKSLARFPHEYETFLWRTHTVPNGDPAEPFADNTKFNCMMLIDPLTTTDEFHELRVSDEKTISFFALVPLYAEEVELKLKKGADALLARFEKCRVNEVLNIKRTNTCATRARF
jgi:hypothetical protein